MRFLKLKGKIILMCLISFWKCWGNPPYTFLASLTRDRSYTGPSNTFTTNHSLLDRLTYPKPFL